MLRTVWLAPRPVRLGGDWGVGCTFCAELRQKHCDAKDDARRDGGVYAKGRRRGPGHANTKWARFGIRSVDQIASRGVRQHADTAQHKLAVKAHFAPNEAVTIVEQVCGGADREVFRGGVPQVDDWVRAWGACRTPQSFQAAEAHGITENFLKGSRVPATSRKAFRAMVRVMACALRERKLRALRLAKAISIAFDDRKAYRFVSFKCSLSEPVLGCSGVQGHVVSGCLAVLRRGGDFSHKELSHSDEDYSKEMANSIIRGIQSIAQCPRTGQVDNTLVTDICRRVRIAVADGCACAQKCCRYLAVNHMPNLLWCGRDRAHALRIATSQPLLKEDKFKAWWDDTFCSKFALVPAIQNSEEWLAKLELCQKHVLRCSGVQGCGVTAVTKTLSFAKQRFDSMASPQLMFCITLVAIAMLLAYVSSDGRTEPSVRRRARRRLEQMPDHVLTAGLSASYSDQALRFVRLFDTADHDPALTYSQQLHFLDRMKVLFMDGRIWDAVDEEASTTPIAIIWQEARSAQPIYYDDDGKVLHLFRKPTPAQAQELNDSVQALTTSMIERVKAELPLHDLGMLFTAFDLARWHAARCDMSARADECKFATLQGHARAMFRSWRLDASSGVPALTSMAFRLCGLEEKNLKDGKPRDNRVVWTQVLQGGMHEPQDAGDALLPMLHIYLSAMDSTCGVERDLGSLTRMLHSHSGPVDEDGSTIAYCTEVLVDGPKDATGLGVQANGGHECLMLPTDLTRECAALWVELHGRRFRVYKPGSRRPGPPRSREGTIVAVKKKVKQSMDALVSRRAPDADTPTILGLPRRSFIRQDANPQLGKGLLGKFDDLTRKKVVATTKLNLARRSHGLRNPYAAPGLNPNDLPRKARATQGARLPSDAPAVEVAAGRRIAVLSCCREPITARIGYTVADLDVQSAGVQQGSGVSLLSSIRRCDMLLLDSPWALDQVHRLSDVLMVVFVIAIALGKTVLPRRCWARCMPWGPSPGTVVQFHPIYCTAPQKIVVTERFRQNHALLERAFHLIARLPRSKWKVSVGAAAVLPDVPFDSAGDVRHFLLQARRVRHQGGGLLGGAYFPVRAE